MNEKSILSHEILKPFLEQELSMNSKVESSVNKLGHLVTTLLGQKCVSQNMTRERDIFWDANHFGLDKVSFFQDLPDTIKAVALALLTDHNLNESYYIEKVGMSYCAKMILLSESEEEKALYSAIAGDEATHLYEVRNFLRAGQEQTYRGNGFLKFIAETVQNESPKICQAILQVGLEGYGIGYYHWLKQGCLDKGFQNVLARIITDEASHHGSGVIITSQNKFSEVELTRLHAHFDQLANFLNCTLFPIVMVLERLSEGLTNVQRTEIFAELEALTVNSEKMKNLWSLLRVSKLDRNMPPGLANRFNQGWDAVTCANVFTQMLSEGM